MTGAEREFLAQLRRDNEIAQEHADSVREAGNDARARRMEIDEADRTMWALEGMGLEL